MTTRHKRYLKNYLINKNFQFKFLFRIFLFTFVILTIGSLFHYYISTKTIFNELNTINEETKTRQKQILAFLEKNQSATNPIDAKLPPALQNLMNHAFADYNRFLNNEIRFINTQINHTQTILLKKKADLLSAFWNSLLIAGILINVFFALVYGIFLSHKLAGNHYRLQQFAKQLQEKNLASPLIVRKSDFFQETATELDKARKTIQNDITEIKNKNARSLDEIINCYKL